MGLGVPEILQRLSPTSEIPTAITTRFSGIWGRGCWGDTLGAVLAPGVPEDLGKEPPGKDWRLRNSEDQELPWGTQSSL
jgi:hypothetical protein